MKHTPFFVIGLLAVLFLSFGTTSSQAQPASVPNITGPTAGSYEEGTFHFAQWNDPGLRGLWFQIYVQRDGSFYFSKWIRADEAGVQFGGSASLGILPPGDYRLWVQAWEPCFGHTDFDSVDFTVECTPVAPPTLDEPFGSFDGYWPVGFCTSGDTSEGVTWTEIEVYQEGIFLGSHWTQLPSPGNGINVPTIDLPFLSLGFEEGDYVWRARSYSPCWGIGLWSADRSFLIDNTDCETAPNPYPMGAIVDLTHGPTGTPGEGNVPQLTLLRYTGTSWARSTVVSMATGAVVDQQWLHYSQGFSTTLPFLPPGTYHIYREEYNLCGLGPVSDVPDMFTVASKEAGRITNMNFRGFDCDGEPYIAWDAQVGNDWYEVYVASGPNVFYQWVNVNNLGMGSPVWADPATDRILCQPDIPCAGRLTVWVRSYANSGQLGRWENFTLPAEWVPDAPMLDPVTFNGDNRPILSWSSTTLVGAYEIYVTRSGRFYLDAIIECEETGDNPMGEEYPPLGNIPSSVQSFFNFCPGDFTVYVRSIVEGSAAGPWSDPRDFSVPEPF